MVLTKEEAIKRARADLAKRLSISESEITESKVEQTEFPDLALGAPEEDELSGQMITTGWRIELSAHGHKYEYRADRNQLRLYNFKGANYRI